MTERGPAIIGHVELTISEDQMLRIIQDWVNKSMPDGPLLVVRGINYNWVMEGSVPGHRIRMEGLKQFVTGTP